MSIDLEALIRSIVRAELRALFAPPPKKPAVKFSGRRACAIKGCTRPHLAKGFCSRHYEVRRHHKQRGTLPSSWVENAAPHSLAPTPHAGRKYP